MKYKLAILFLGIWFSGIAQNAEDNYDPVEFLQINKQNTNTLSNIHTFDKNTTKWTYNLTMGSSFMGSSFGSAVDLYTVPQINYNFSSKWQISAGLLFINSTYSNPNQGETNINQTRSYLMNKLSYQATQKLRISGEILYGMNNASQLSGMRKKNDYYVNFDAEYKVNDSFSIGFRISGSNMSSPYGLRPLYSGYNPISSPFYHSPFNY